MNKRKPTASPPPPPPPTPPPPTTEEPRAVDLLQKIREGRISGRNLSQEQRQSMVELLVADGLSTPEIAKILDVADRTVDRDRRAIRQRHAVVKHPALVAETVGRLVSEAENSVQRIRRVTRDRETDAAVRIDGEHRCIQIQFDLVRAMQSLGYLPTAAQRLEAQVTHTELPAMDDLTAEIARLKLIPGAENIPAMAELDGALERALLASRVKKVTQTLDGTEVIGDATA